jgi:hypothetical protein
MKDREFDHLLSAIRNEPVDDKVVAQAGERVWKSMAGAPVSAELDSHMLRSCEDFKQLIPTHLRNQLTPARSLLFEDHVHACVACRRALQLARDGAPQRVWQLARKPSFAVWRWGMAAATLAFGIVVGFALTNGLFPGQHSVRATVQTVEGSLYDVSGSETRLIPAGYEIKDGDEIRTAKASTAMVRLEDGSVLELGERSDLSVSRKWKGTTIHLDGGQVIVQAAKQGSGHLYVATDDGLVSVKGTIFSVNHGIKGSRVAVIEGVVRVDYGDNPTELRAGDEATSGASVSKVPIRDEIAWSRNSAKYLALLGEFSILQKQFAAIPSPGLRYSSDLLPYVPDHTVVYAAIPNLSHTLEEAGRLFQDRLQQSPELRTWWKQQQKGGGPKLEDVLNEVKTFSSYLGDEIVFAVAKDGADYSAPVILARIRQPGLESFLQRENRKLNPDRSHVAVEVVRDPVNATPLPGRPLLVYVGSDLLIATPDLAGLRQSVTMAQQGNRSHFAETPFYQQIVHSYEQGAEWLFCTDMEQILNQAVPEGSNRNGVPAGMADVRYLTMEHREVSGKSESRADLTFANERQGVASWLAAPAPMGSLEFVSPNASMVTSAVIKNPRGIMEEVFKMIGSGDANFSEHLAEFESKSGVNVLNDITAPLGGEVTMAFDGPMIPTPRWKLIIEVYDSLTLQATIAKLVDTYNREAKTKSGSLQLTERHLGSRTYYVVNSTTDANCEIDYTFVDSYLIAAPDLATIQRAIQSREAGYTLTHSSTFQALLPNDGYTSFSAIFYHNVGPVVGPLTDQLKASGALNPEQRQAVNALAENSAPGMIYAYGEPDRISVASNTGFMGFDLGTLLTMGNNGPFLPQMFLGRTLNHPPQTK